MRPLTDLPTDALQAAHDAAGTLIEHKAFLPGGLLLMLVSRFRDDIRDVLGIEPEGLPKRGRERRPPDEMTSMELDAVAGAVILLKDRFPAVMDDPALPKLLREFSDALDEQRAERAQLRADIGYSS